ncbi:hypothetical protein VE02_02686 [Pseudogymnoascus sp. 03VT05]|nr:hypothetical protein VE02_02686 [Pseudogymnoascus sp. 03VT05]
MDSVGTIIAIIQVADRVIGLCKFYIETADGAPLDLRSILVEISSFKAILETLQFISSLSDAEKSTNLNALFNPDGPIDHSQKLVLELEKLIPSQDLLQAADSKASQPMRNKAKRALITLGWPLKESKAAKLMGEIARCKTTISLALTTESSQDIKIIKDTTTRIKEDLTDNQKRDISTWFQRTDPSPLHNIAYGHYVVGTGDWMLESSDWKDWICGDNKFLWIHGIPGAGKTVLASYLIETIAEHCRTVKKQYGCMYYYCSYTHNQNEAYPLLHWIVSQLLRKSNSIPITAYEQFKSGLQPSILDLLDILESCLAEFECVFVVVDAVDESMSPRQDLLKTLRDLATDLRFAKIQLLATSREYVDIETVLENISCAVSMDNENVTNDIRSYVQAELQRNTRFLRWPQQLLEEVENIIPTKAKGMFRWAVCQIDRLQRMKPERPIIMEALYNLPKTLDETYERIFLEIPLEDWAVVRQVFEWTLFHSKLYGTKVPCEIVIQALEKNPLADTYGNGNFYDDTTIKELCGCLITISNGLPFGFSAVPEVDDEDENDVFRPPSISFAHYTVLEFLDSERISRSRASYFAFPKDHILLDLVKAAILMALNPTTYTDGHGSDEHLTYSAGNFLQNVVDKSLNQDSDETQETEYWSNRKLIGNFAAYCAASAVLSINHWPEQISQSEGLNAFVFALYNPYAPHYNQLFHFLSCLEASHSFVDTNTSLYDGGLRYDPGSTFWEIKWISPPLADVGAIFLLLLWTKSLVFTKRPDHGVQIFQAWAKTRLNFEMVVNRESEIRYTRAHKPLPTYRFSGQLLEILAQLGYFYPEEFRFFLGYKCEETDSSALLVSYIGSHAHVKNCRQSCPVEVLLQTGADPMGKNYYVTPIQIAVGMSDYEGCRMLLEAGADSNDTGNNFGAKWEDDSYLARFNALHGRSPLNILQVPWVISHEDDRYEDMSDFGKLSGRIKALLLSYGARSFPSYGDTTMEDKDLLF